MAKGVILTELPLNCYECSCHNYHECCWTGESVEDYMDTEQRHPECPIQEFPKYKQGSMTNSLYESGKIDGWNECLSSILHNHDMFSKDTEA